MSGPQVDIRLDRSDRVYGAGETVTGAVVVTTQSSMRQSGIKMTVRDTLLIKSLANYMLSDR